MKPSPLPTVFVIGGLAATLVVWGLVVVTIGRRGDGRGHHRVGGRGDRGPGDR